VSAIPNPFQTPITTLEKYYEDTLYAELEPLLNDEDDIKRSCDACISLIKTMKRFCYFPERLHLAIMSNVCKRTKLVDDQVVKQKNKKKTSLYVSDTNKTLLYYQV
jgi:sphingomyelin phosphodiesterase